MVSFKDMVGDEAGPVLDYYAVYIFLFLVIGIVYYVGVFRLLYKVAQQMFIIFFMCCISALWWILVMKHVSFMQEASGTNKTASMLFSTGNGSAEDLFKDVLDDQVLVGPISEIILITGTTVMILSWLYRQLPIDLIPDFIPCIGKYDNMFAGFWLFIGLLITLVGVYLQLYYVIGPNSTKLINQYFTDFTENFRSFLKLSTEKQIQHLSEFSQDVMVSLIKFSHMMRQSFMTIFQQLQGALKKKEEL